MICKAFKLGNLLRPNLLIRSFERKRNLLKERRLGDKAEAVPADKALAQRGVTVDVRAERLEGIIEVHPAKVFQADDAIHLGEHVVNNTLVVFLDAHIDKLVLTRVEDIGVIVRSVEIVNEIYEICGVGEELGYFLYDRNYIRPQESGSHYACKYLAVKNLFKVTAEQPFSCSVNPFTTAQLRETLHSFELEENDFVNVCIDLAMRGVGSHSCGPDLSEEYEIPKTGKNTFKFTF